MGRICEMDRNKAQAELLLERCEDALERRMVGGQLDLAGEVEDEILEARTDRSNRCLLVAMSGDLTRLALTLLVHDPLELLDEPIHILLEVFDAVQHGSIRPE